MPEILQTIALHAFSSKYVLRVAKRRKKPKTERDFVVEREHNVALLMKSI
jgi:hypothetical protein